MGPDAAREATLAAIDAGIAAIESTAGRVDPPDPSACTGWTVHDLVRHLEAIAGAYVLWAGAAIGGRIGRMRTPRELEDYNDQMLQRLPERSTDRHLQQFGDLARDHRRLVATGWSHPMLHTPGDALLRVGDHGRLAAVEWHLHAWDLGEATDDRHRPTATSLEVLCGAWDQTLGDLAGVPRDTGDDPWTFLLAATGRIPT